MLDNDIDRFYFLKTDKIRKDLDATDIEPNELNRLLPVDPAVENKLHGFHLLSQEDVLQLVQGSAKKTCSLDPMPTSMVVNCQDELLSVITCMINSSLSSGYFPPGWKNALVLPFRKKPGHYNSFQNLRPVRNLQLVSKLTSVLSLIKFTVTWKTWNSFRYILYCNLQYGPKVSYIVGSA